MPRLVRGIGVRARTIGLVAAMASLTTACGPARVQPSSYSGTEARPGSSVLGVGVGEGWAWALTCDERCSEADGRRSAGRVLRLDPVSAEIRASVGVQRPHAVAVGEGAVWVIGFWDDTVTRIDPATDRVVASIKLSLPYEVAPEDRAFLPSDVSVGEGAVWVVTARGAVARIDPVRNEVAAVIELPREAVTGGIAAGEGAVWVAGSVSGVHRIDPTTNRLTATIPVTQGEDGALAVDEVTVGEGAVWTEGVWTIRSVDESGHVEYETTEEAAIARLDPFTGEPGVVVPKLPELDFKGVEDGAIWLGEGPGLVRIDPDAARVTAMLRAEDEGRVVAVRSGSAWVAGADGTIGRLGLSEARPCPPVEVAYQASLTRTSGPPDSPAAVTGPVPLYKEDGAFGPTERIEVWWNADPEQYWTVRLPEPSPFAPGPVLFLGEQDVLWRCTFRFEFRVPKVPAGTYTVLALHGDDTGFAVLGQERFEVTG
jgi:streptogramin lyase